MTHQDALQEMAVEKYLLGELSGASLDTFEEHLFDCSECAADVKAGTAFIDAARPELGMPRKVAASRPEHAPKWSSWFTSPWILGPALAACLALLSVQAFILQPRMKLEIARAQAPGILNPLVLANAGARGDSLPEVVAPEHGSFVISLDVPSTGGFSSYLCSLQAPDGSILWQTTVSAEQASDSLLISMPTDRTKEGLNIFLVQGLSSNGGSSGKLENLARYQFQLKVQR
jgi:hypothetical protein